MEQRWDLSQLYQSFEDKQFLEDIEKVKQTFTQLQKYPQLEKTTENLVCYLKKENELNDLIERLYSYVNLVINADTMNH